MAHSSRVAEIETLLHDHGSRWTKVIQRPHKLPIVVVENPPLLRTLGLIPLSNQGVNEQATQVSLWEMGSSSNSKTSAPHAENSGAIPGESTHTVPWSNGNGAWLTPKRRRFDSVRDYFHLPIPKPGQIPFAGLLAIETLAPVADVFTSSLIGKSRPHMAGR